MIISNFNKDEKNEKTTLPKSESVVNERLSRLLLCFRRLDMTSELPIDDA